MLKLLTTTFGLALAMSAQAQTDYPARPIKLITVASAGGGGDTIARLYAEKLTPILKTTFLVDNRPGAGGALAMEGVARAPGDGYTIGLGGFSSNVLLPIVRTKMSYDPVKDFAPIGQIGTAAVLLVATNDFPANNLKELIALDKKAPGSQMYASWGIGSTGHFCGELLNQRAGTHFGHVPYRSVSAIMNDLLGSQIKLAIVDMGTGTPMVKAGRIKALGSCVARSPSLPEVRGFAEDGVDFVGTSLLLPMWAFYAPAGTPRPIVDKLTAAFKQVTEMADVKDKLLELGVNADFMPGDKFRELLAAGIPQWRAIATKSNIKVDE
jgi:tripartite-type tricarboxylate transporter receptor subunit TctC